MRWKRNTKAGCRADERSPRKVIALITRLKAKWPVLVLGHLFGVHRSVYYAQVRSPIDVQRVELRSRVRAFHALSRGAQVVGQSARCCARVALIPAGGWLDD